MSNKVVVSFADGVGNYAKAMMRLEQSMRAVHFDGTAKMINDYEHIGSPLHKAPASFNPVPYAFKPCSIRKAFEEGADLVLWCDSVVYATKSINPIFDHIDRHGYLLFDNIGFTIGDYTSDACLLKHGMCRNEAFTKPMVMACVMGFKRGNPESEAFLKYYIDAAFDGVSYLGDWTNQDLQVSNDMRVKGHRHDQSVASIIASQLGMDLTRAQDTYFAYTSHKGIVPIADSVCLWSEGI